MRTCPVSTAWPWPCSSPPFTRAVNVNLLLIREITTTTSFSFVELPFTPLEKSNQQTIYQIDDNFFEFWFRFVYPNKSDIEGGETDKVLKKIKNEFNVHVSRTYEQVCREFLTQLNYRDETPFHFSKIGIWWGHYRENNVRKEIEIDNVAINEETKEVLFVECKWQNNVNAEKILRELKEKAKHVDWNRGERKEYYVVFAKSFRERVSGEDVLLFDLGDVEEVFRQEAE